MRLIDEDLIDEDINIPGKWISVKDKLPDDMEKCIHKLMQGAYDTMYEMLKEAGYDS